MDVLTGSEREEIIDKIKEFQREFQRTSQVGKKAHPKRVNNLTKYAAEEKRPGKANMPRSCASSNELEQYAQDARRQIQPQEIMDGAKTIVCKFQGKSGLHKYWLSQQMNLILQNGPSNRRV